MQSPRAGLLNLHRTDHDACRSSALRVPLLHRDGHRRVGVRPRKQARPSLPEWYTVGLTLTCASGTVDRAIEPAEILAKIPAEQERGKTGVL
jgi:hypothetical protein